MPSKLRVDFHCHTHYSNDSLTSISALIETARRRGLDRLVITDHNTITGAKAGKELAPDLIIIGEEVKTTRGEFLAAFVTEEVPAGLEPWDALARLKAQGAFVCASHPFDPFREHWSKSELLDFLPDLDAIETRNARCLWTGSNQRASAFAELHNLSVTGGSDAHTAKEVGGAGVMLSYFEDANGLRKVIHDGKVFGNSAPLWVHLYSRWANFQRRNKKMELD